MRPTVTRGLRIGTAVVVLALTISGLLELAQHRFTTHLRDDAARELAFDAAGGTPWIWVSRAHDIVAGRVFGDAHARFTADGLRVESRGSPFEIGLRLDRPLPLRAFPCLRVSATTDVPARVEIVVRERLDGAALTSSPISIEPDSGTPRIDLAAIAWRDAENRPAPMPSSIAMLRLRFTLPHAAVLRFDGAKLERSALAVRFDLTRKPTLLDAGNPIPANAMAVVRIPDAGFDAAQIVALARSDAPILALAQTQRIERQRLLLDSIHAALPAAIVVPQTAMAATFAQARSWRGTTQTQASLRWIALIAYAVALLLARLFPPRRPRLRAALEACLVLAGPLWLVAGGHFTGEVDHAQELLIACIVIYAISLGFPRDWDRVGSGRAWQLALAVVALAGVVAVVGYFRGDGSVRPIPGGHVWRYFGWALVQQYLVCVACVGRWKIATGNDVIAIYLGALGFALLHTPNADLMLATFFGGLCWCALYLRERALLPIAVSHATSALILIALLPQDWLYSAEVSARFFQ